MKIKVIRKMFNELNRDAKKSGESVVSFSDVEYYTDQIQNIFGVSEAAAKRLANKLNNKIQIVLK